MRTTGTRRVHWRHGVLLAAVGMLMPLLASSARQAEAGHAHATGYHWARAANPVVIQAGSDVTFDSQPYVQQAASDWSRSAVLDVVVGAGSGRSDCPFVTGKITVCNGAYGETGWAGLASYVADRSGHITAARAQVNDTYLLGHTPYYRQFLFCHEIGHTLGLGHDDANPDSCMNTRGESTGVSPVPGAHDYEELEAIYAHLDTRTKPGRGPKASRPDHAGETVDTVELPDGRILVTITTPA